MCNTQGAYFTLCSWISSPTRMCINKNVVSSAVYHDQFPLAKVVLLMFVCLFALAKLKLQPYGHCCPQWVKQELGVQNKMGLVLVLISICSFKDWGNCICCNIDALLLKTQPPSNKWFHRITEYQLGRRPQGSSDPIFLLKAKEILCRIKSYCCCPKINLPNGFWIFHPALGWSRSWGGCADNQRAGAPLLERITEP